MNNPVIAAAAICIGLGGSLLGTAAWMLFCAWRSLSWPSVWGLIADADAPSPAGGNRPTAFVGQRKVAYDYRVGQRELRGCRVFFGDVFWEASSPARDARSEPESYPPGQEVRVFFDPDAPARSVLRRGIDERLYMLVVLGVLFLMAGAGMLGNLLRVVE